MEKKLLLAVTLSIIVMLLYPLFIAKVNPPPAQGDFISQQVENKEVVAAHITEESPKDILATLPVDAESKRVNTSRYEINLSNIGGSVQGIRIKDGKRLDIDLVQDAIYESGILAIEGKGALADLSSQPFVLKEDTNSFYVEKNSLAIDKKISFLKDSYALKASINITNNSSSTQSLSFEITTASNIADKEKWETRYIGADVLYRDGRVKRVASYNSKKYNQLYQSDIEWLALRNKYYSIIAKPEFIPQGIFTKKIGASPVVGFIVDEKIFPGETKIYDFLFYIGPTELNELQKAGPSFGKALYFGKLTSISLVLLSVLNFFYGLSHNYGVAILLLTCCVSLLLFPLSFKSLKSMRKLQELQPQIEKIRLQHKDSPQKLNKEIMEMYRRYKVNPMGGCLPLFLQMPIFIALYQTLMRSVELKGAAFLWIKDLSMPDAAFQLPFKLPFLGSAINLLPILMIGAMIIQQKLSQAKTGAQTEQQKMMANIMPIMFGFIFYSLPAGLVLYWLTNTLLTSSLQYAILRKT